MSRVRPSAPSEDADAAADSETLRGAEAVRLVARHVPELVLERGLRWQAATGTNRIDCLLFQVVLSANLAGHPYRDHNGQWHGLTDGGEALRPLSAMSVAQSTGLPYETVRRRSTAMQKMGLLASTRAGITVDPAIRQDLFADELIAEDVTALLATAASLSSVGYGPAVDLIAALPLQVPADVQARVLLDFTVRSLETFVDHYGDFVTGTVSAAIVAANVRHLLHDPFLARRYARGDAPPPDDVRQPVTVRTLARELELPFETVRRRVAEQIARGWAVAVEDGVIVPAAVLREERYTRTNHATQQHFERMIRDLLRL